MMNIRLQAMLLSAGFVILACWAAPAVADEWNKRTTFSFDKPVEVPGHVLTPGKYVFELADLPADRNVVQIFSEDKTGTDHLVTTLMAVPDYHMNTPENPGVTFEERRATSPEAIHSWSYPGDNYGWEFVYPKSERLQVAANTTPAPVQTVTPAPAPKPAAPATTTNRATVASTPKPAAQPVTIAQNRTPAPPPQTSTQNQTASTPPKQLPKTASDLPLFESTGALMAALGGLILLLGKRRARV